MHTQNIFTHPNIYAHPVYPALLPLWTTLANAIANVDEQSRHLNGPPRVCFVGRFKTGKSRLINALVDSDVLPYNTDECTAQLIELVWNGRDKASHLKSLNLDSAPEQAITREQFRDAVDLTAMSGGKERAAEATAFRYHLTSPLLRTIRIADTPGFDGPNAEARERAEAVRQQALRQSAMCVLVLSAGLSEDDVKCAHLIKDQGLEMIVVLNQADKYDAEDRQEMRDQILEGLAEKVGARPAFYTCSARWQNGSGEDRDQLQRQRRYFEPEEETQWHQWDALVRRLSRPHEGNRHVAFLAAIHHVFDAAQQVNDAYDLTRQAEAVFLEHLPRWRKMMPSLIGQTVLEMAVSAAKDGRPLPWKRLENFGITPTMIAPESILPTFDFGNLLAEYAKVLAQVVRFAKDQHAATLYRFLLSEIPAFAASLEESGKKSEKLASGLSAALKSSMEEAAWYSQPLREDFAYKDALAGLQDRWNVKPALIDDDCTRIRQRLAAALV